MVSTVFARPSFHLTLLGCLLLAMWPTAHAAPLTQKAQQSPRDPLRITAVEGGWVRITQGQVVTALNLGQHIHGCVTQFYDGMTGEKDDTDLPYSLRVIDEVRKNGFWYVVLEAGSGPNCNVQGECGAGGPNTDLIWLKLNRRLEVVAKQAENLELCQTGREIISMTGKTKGPPDSQTTLLELRGGVLDIETQDATMSGNYTHLRYDRRYPERGLMR